MKAYQPPLRVVVPDRVRILTASRVYLSLPVMVIVVVVAAGTAALQPLVASGLLVASVGLYVPWSRPRWVFFTFLVLLAFSVEVPLGSTVKMDLPTEALIPGLLVVVVLRSLLKRELRLLRSRLWLPVLVFAAYFVVTLPGTRFPLVSAKAILRDWVHLAGGFVLSLLLVRSRQEVACLLKWAIAASTVLVVYGLLTQIREGIAIYQTIASPFFREHSIYAGFLGFFLAITLGLIFSGYARSSWVRFGYLPLMGLALGLTFVRGAWLALGISTLVIVWIYRRRMPLAFVTTAAIGAGVLVVISLFLGITDLFAERAHHFADPEYVTNLDRLDRWGSAVQIWREHRIVGAGWGTYADEYFDHVFIRRAFSTDQRMGAHNLYLEMLADGGVVALALFLTVIAVFFLEANRVLGKVRGDALAEGLCVGALAAVSGYLFHVAVNNLGPSDKISVLFWFSLVLVPVAEHLWENRHHPYGKPLPSPAD